MRELTTAHRMRMSQAKLCARLETPMAALCLAKETRPQPGSHAPGAGVARGTKDRVWARRMRTIVGLPG